VTENIRKVSFQCVAAAARSAAVSKTSRSGSERENTLREVRASLVMDLHRLVLRTQSRS